MDYCVISFASTHGAIAAQKALEGEVSFVIMPVLREISRGCGISVRFAPEDLVQARAALKERGGLDPAEYAFYGITGHGKTLQAQLMEE